MAGLTKKNINLFIKSCISRNYLPANPLRNVNHKLCTSTSTNPAPESSGLRTIDELSEAPTSQNISRAMKLHLKRVEDYAKFMKQEKLQFERAKNFLAKIMKKDPEKFDQAQIDEAIQYLFPSALHDKNARPCFKDPTLLFQKEKLAEFDTTGRPYHFLFYTLKPNFSQILHDCGTKYETLNKKLEKELQSSRGSVSTTKLPGASWISQKDLEVRLSEKILTIEYEKFIEAMEQLSSHPYSGEVLDFISKFRHEEETKLQRENLPKMKEIKDGIFEVTITKSKRKRCRGIIKLVHPGTGIVKINNMELIEFFMEIQPREDSPTTVSGNMHHRNLVDSSLRQGSPRDEQLDYDSQRNLNALDLLLFRN